VHIRPVASASLRAVIALAVVASVAAFMPVTGSHGVAQAAGVGDCNADAAWPANNQSFADQVVALVNQHRAAMGLVQLKVSPTLTAAAVWKARHMAQYSYMQHDDPAPPIARLWYQRVQACGYTGGGMGENIAYGYRTPQDVMTGWLNSPGHKANIENGSYRSTGVGAATNASGTVYWSQEFGTYVDSGSGGGGGGGGVSAPTVSLTSGPSSSTTSTSASFGWSTSGTVTSTTCSIDGGAATSCTSPKAYSGLAVGSHTFRVTVANSAGSASAAYPWTITTTTPPPPPPPPTTSAPRVTLTSGTGRLTTSHSATFTWTTSGTVTSTTCSLDYGTPVSCSSPWQASNLQRGSHRFTVTVSGPGGSSTASAAWYVYM
jgi:uncharacterized protein YkwD